MKIAKKQFTTANHARYYYEAIPNPNAFYERGSSNMNWFNTTSNYAYNLWDASCAEKGPSDKTIVKTVYDPCPVKYHVPNGRTFTRFSNGSPNFDPNKVGSWDYGFKFKRNSSDTVGIFFPASGYRHRYDGSLGKVSVNGDYWTAAVYSDEHAHYLSFLYTYVDPTATTFRAYACSL